MQGIILNYNVSLKDIIRPLKDDLSELYWITDLQSGPINEKFAYASTQIQNIIENAFIDLPVIKLSSTYVWKPKILTEYPDYILLDEWSYFIGIKCFEDKIERIVNEFYNQNYLSNLFFDKIKEYSEIFILYIDEWWEIYSKNDLWNKKIISHFEPGGINSNKWKS